MREATSLAAELEHLLCDLVRKVVREELAAVTAEPAPDHVTVAEYARARSISEGTVRAAIRDNRLPCIRIGRAVRVPANVEIGRRAANEDQATEHALTVLLGVRG